MNRSSDGDTGTPEPMSAVKAKALLAAIRCEKTLSELAQQFTVWINQTKQWRDQLPEGAVEQLGSEARPEPQAPAR